MKKSLVALAALAVVGAASAQVSLTGNISFSQQSGYGTSRPAEAMSDNSIFLGGSEDLGGGNKLDFSTGFDAGGRTAAGTEDASVSVSGAFGKVLLNSYESHSPVDDNVLISGSAQNNSMHDTAAFGAKLSNRMGMFYMTPAMNGLTGKLGYVRNQDGSNGKAVFGATFVSGGLKVYGEYDSFDSNYGNGTIMNSDGTSTTIAAAGATAYNAYVVYNAGVATFAAGYNKNSYDSNGTTTYGVNVPMGAVSFGLDGASYNGAQLTEIGVNYALSKSTSLKAGYGYINNNALLMSGTATAGVVGATSAAVAPLWMNNSQYRVGLFKSF